MTDQTPTLDDYVTQAELARDFGVTERAVSSWRGIPRSRIGRVVFFRKTDVARWIDRRITSGASAKE